MTDQDDINAALLTNAIGPKRVSVGDEQVESQSPADLIKAGEYLAGQAAAAKPHFGFRFSQIVPPGGGGTP